MDGKRESVRDQRGRVPRNEENEENEENRPLVEQLAIDSERTDGQKVNAADRSISLIAGTSTACVACVASWYAGCVAFWCWNCCEVC